MAEETTGTTPVIATRCVHLDLKGVPPTFSRLLRLLRIFADIGYNAVLVEWEDMFPWTVDERFRCETAYTPKQVQTFHETAEAVGLDVIPLVQCLGHMETPLSVPGYEYLREVPGKVDVLNPLAEDARQLVEDMVEDVLSAMPRPAYFHLGGDEAWSFGSHPDTREYIEQHGKGALYLYHVEPILDSLLARDIRPILWHDMMLSWEDEPLTRLAEKADLCVWGYRGRPDQTRHHHRIDAIRRLESLGIRMWGGTAYKGASGPDSDLPDKSIHRENALGYADVGKTIELQGVVATAWSRYSTHYVQCEPIDAALDSAAEVAMILRDGKLPDPDEAMTVLEEAGERKQFEDCYRTMRALADARRACWNLIREFREQRVTAEQDPRRRGRDWPGETLGRLERHIGSLLQAANDVREVFAGLIEPPWLERYLDERVEAVRREYDSLRREEPSWEED